MDYVDSDFGGGEQDGDSSRSGSPAEDGERDQDDGEDDHIDDDSKRFSIPYNDEDLIYDALFRFVVKKGVTLEEAYKAIKGFTKFVDEGEYFEIHTFFDDFFHIARRDGFIRKWDLWLDLIQLLLEGFTKFKPDLVNTVCHVASSGIELPENMKGTCADRIEILEMFVYLIKNLVIRLEDIAIRKFNEMNGMPNVDGVGLELDEDVILDENMSEEGLHTWNAVRLQVLETIDFISCLNISRGNGEVIENAVQFLSRPPGLHPELLKCFATIILKFASHPRFAKKNARDELGKLFTHMRPVCIGFDYGNSFAEDMVDATLKFEYLKDARSDYPFVDLVARVAESGSMLEQMLSVMLMRLWRIVPPGFTGTLGRPYVLLVQKLSQEAPEAFLYHCSQSARALDFDPPTIRTAILEAFGYNICNNELLAPSAHMRPGSSICNSYMIMTDSLLQHLEDVNPQVRLNVLNIWVNIANARRVPFDSIRKGLFNTIVERLKSEKSAPARKLALQFLVLYLLVGPYGKELNFDVLTEACSKLANFIRRIEVIDPERPGVQVITERFNKFVDEMKAKLTHVIETKKFDDDNQITVDEPTEEVIVAMVHMIELRMDEVMYVLAKMCFLGKINNINTDGLSTEEIVNALIAEFRRYYFTIHIGNIGDSIGQKRLEEMGTAYEENMDRAERAINVIQEKMLFAQQMTFLLPHVYEAVEQNGFVDINYAVTLFATCYRFKIKTSACALYRIYTSDNKNAQTEVLNTVRMLFLKRNARGDVDIVETANCLMERLSDKHTDDRFAVEELIVHAFSPAQFPTGLVTHLIDMISVLFSPFRWPAVRVLGLLARIDPYGMRKHLRVLQKCLKSDDICEACEALKALSRLIPSTEVIDSVKDEENSAFRLRVMDSLFCDIEELFFKVFLSDDEYKLPDETLMSDYFFPCTQATVNAIFTLSANVDYMASRFLAKVIFYAKHSADLLISFAEMVESKNIKDDVLVELAKQQKRNLGVIWQRTSERALVLIGEVVQESLRYIENNFPKQLKRAMELDDEAAMQLEEATEPYEDYAKEHTDVEMDYAYREGIFARTIASAKPKNADSQQSSKASEKGDVEAQQSENSEAAEEDEEDDESNRPSIDELIRTRTVALLETRLLDKDAILGRCLTMVVYFIRTPGIPKPVADAALRTFSKFMFVSPRLTDRASSLFLTCTCCHVDADMREYLFVAAVDVMQRFPSMLDRCALFLFEMPVDPDPNVKITAILYLTQMLKRDVVKPRGTLSNVALCMLKRSISAGSVDLLCSGNNRKVMALARKLFTEVSSKGNMLVNVMPDLVCRVCRSEKEVSLNNFKYIIEKLLPLISDRPLDTIVEKMCQRFEFCNSPEATRFNAHIAHYFSYFISQIPLSDSSFYKMRGSLAYFASFLEDEVVYHDFISPIHNLVTSTQSTDVKHDIEEFLRKIDFLHVKSSLSEEERDKMSKAVGPINLDVPVKLDKDGNPIQFSFADCDEPVEYDDS